MYFNAEEYRAQVTNDLGWIALMSVVGLLFVIPTAGSACRHSP
jgi:hypothetical protein